MIKIYTLKEICPKPMITFNDMYFNTNVSSSYLDSYCRNMLKRIDGVEIQDEATWLITTRLGVGDIRNISTGLKTLINIYNMKKQGNQGTVDIREVGENLIPLLLKIADGSCISLYTGLYNFIGLIDASYVFLVDNKYEVRGTVGLELQLEQIQILRRQKQ